MAKKLGFLLLFLMWTTHALAAEGKRKKSGRIPRPMNSFLIYAKDQREVMSCANPHLENREISQLLGEQWRSMTAEEQEPYRVQADIAAAQHKLDYPDYKFVRRQGNSSGKASKAGTSKGASKRRHRTDRTRHTGADASDVNRLLQYIAQGALGEPDRAASVASAASAENAPYLQPPEGFKLVLVPTELTSDVMAAVGLAMINEGLSVTAAPTHLLPQLANWMSRFRGASHCGP